MGLTGNVYKVKDEDICRMQQLKLHLNLTESVPDSAVDGLDTINDGLELSAVHHQTEKILEDRYGARYSEHLAAAMARYLDWRTAKRAARDRARSAAIGRRQAKQGRSGNDAPDDGRLVDLPKDK